MMRLCSFSHEWTKPLSNSFGSKLIVSLLVSCSGVDNSCWCQCHFSFAIAAQECRRMVYKEMTASWMFKVRPLLFLVIQLVSLSKAFLVWVIPLSRRLTLLVLLFCLFSSAPSEGIGKTFLSTKTQSQDKGTITIDIGCLKIVEQCATLSNEFG